MSLTHEAIKRAHEDEKQMNKHLKNLGDTTESQMLWERFRQQTGSSKEAEETPAPKKPKRKGEQEHHPNVSKGNENTEYPSGPDIYTYKVEDIIKSTS